MVYIQGDIIHIGGGSADHVENMGALQYSRASVQVYAFIHWHFIV